MKISELLNNIIPVDCKLNREDFTITDLAIDSREVKKGSLFVAYTGARYDGRDFIADAQRKGASAILYEAPSNQKIACDTQSSHCMMLPLVNLKSYLPTLANRFYHTPSQSIKIVAITGTNGKTSTSHFIAQALTQLNNPCGVMGTLGYGIYPKLISTHLTTPPLTTLTKQLAYFRDHHIKNAVIEASSHAIDQNRLAGTLIDTAIFTQLSRDHLDYHGDMETYARVKERLFQHPNLKRAIINLDDPFGNRLIKRYLSKEDIIAYSLIKKSTLLPTILAEEIKPLKTGYQFILKTPWGEGIVKTQLLGEFNISNLLATVGALIFLKIPFSKILTVLPHLTSPPGRMECINNPLNHNQPHTIVDFAHTPDGLAKVLSTLRPFCQGKLIVIFGCGGERDRGKRPEMASVTEEYADLVILTQDNPRCENPEQIIEDVLKGFMNPTEIIIEPNRREAIKKGIQMATSADTLLIAGKGHEETQTIGQNIMPFSDKKVAESYLMNL